MVFSWVFCFCLFFGEGEGRELTVIRINIYWFEYLYHLIQCMIQCRFSSFPIKSISIKEVICLNWYSERRVVETC